MFTYIKLSTHFQENIRVFFKMFMHLENIHASKKIFSFTKNMFTSPQKKEAMGSKEPSRVQKNWTCSKNSIHLLSEKGEENRK
jgi:hypothetical protein